MIEALTGFPGNVLAFACKGHVRKSDYEAILVPRVEKALGQHEKIRLYYEIGGEFTGIDPAAMWEDFKIGVEHLRHWERVAVVTDVAWIKHAMAAFRFLIPGKLRIFPMSEASQARDWIAAP